MRRSSLFSLLLTYSFAALVSGCSDKKVSHGDSTGGNWVPVLVAAKDAIKLPGPPDAKSDQQKKEIDELIALQKQITPEKEATIKFWNASASVRWNEIARDLVAKHRTDAPMSSRVYALVSVAQYDALVATWNHKYVFNREAPDKVSSLHALIPVAGDPVYPSEHVAVAAASAAVLTYIYPDEAKFLESKVAEHGESRLMAGVNFRSDITAGNSLGRDIAKFVIKYAQMDGADAVWTGSIPTVEGRWFSAPNAEPIAPLWRGVKPWFITSIEQFRAAPPATFGSPEFKAALAEVKQVGDNLTPEQARIGAFWADGPGSYTPPGRWNKIAADLILKYRTNEIRAGRIFAILNMSMEDAGIACFDNKYHYLAMRPSQASSAITLRLGLPNHPSYPSAHSCFSGAGADVLGYIFPDEKDSLGAKANEAGLSRLYMGIHYRQDMEAGEVVGRKVGQLAIDRAKSDHSSP